VNPDKGVDVELVSVNNNQFIDVNWKPYYKQLKGSRYVLERSGGGLGGPYSIIRETTALKASDLTADFNANSHAYRVRYRDHCGTLGPFGSASNSVHLFGIPGIQGLTLQWNKYEYWASGAKEYLVQYRNRNTGFITHVVKGPADFSLDNLKLGQFGQDSICFRIAAIQDTATSPDTSYSNWACFVPESRLWIPNSFTPNDDGLNNEFKVEPEFIRNDDPDPNYRFTMKIFNRWGQQVFESYDFNRGWDGKFQGNPVPAGLYILRVNAVGYDGQAYRYKGTIYLSR
jgi:gliding motility-associated-like protein